MNADRIPTDQDIAEVFRRRADHAEPIGLESAVFRATASTRQRRGWTRGVRARFSPPSTRLLVLAVLTTAALGVTVSNMGTQADEPTLRPAIVPRSSSTPSLTPSPSARIALTETFDSSYGYSINYPDDWTVTAAVAAFVPPPAFDDRQVDIFLEPRTGLAIRMFSVVMPSGADSDDWIVDNLTGTEGGVCDAPPSRLEAIEIDGFPARLRDNCHEVEATVVAGQRVYLITLFLPHPISVNEGARWPNFGVTTEPSGGRALFDAFAETIRLHPEEAPGPRASAEPS
jgi:hypothetical protein